MAIPFIPIILALLSFLLTKKATGSTSKAVLAAGLVGAGSYYATKPATIADGSSSGGVVAAEGRPAVDSTGKPIVDANGAPVLINGGGSIGSIDRMIDTTGRVLTSWGATGTAAVIGTTAVTTSSSLQKYLPWILGGAALLFLVK